MEVHDEQEVYGWMIRCLVGLPWGAGPSLVAVGNRGGVIVRRVFQAALLLKVALLCIGSVQLGWVDPENVPCASFEEVAEWVDTVPGAVD